MSNTVKLDNFLHEFNAIVSDFVNDEKERVNYCIKKVGNDTAKKLRTEAPDGAGKYKDWKDYQSGFSAESDMNALGDVTVTVRNKKKPGLTHLLEEGHVTSDGHGYARAFPHIAPAANEAFAELIKELRRDG